MEACFIEKGTSKEEMGNQMGTGLRAGAALDSSDPSWRQVYLSVAIKNTSCKWSNAHII